MKPWKVHYKSWVWDMDGRKPRGAARRHIEHKTRGDAKREIRHSLMDDPASEEAEAAYHKELQEAWYCDLYGPCERCLATLEYSDSTPESEDPDDA